MKQGSCYLIQIALVVDIHTLYMYIYNIKAHLRGRTRCVTAACMVVRKQCLHTTWWPHGSVRIVALALRQMTHCHKPTSGYSRVMGTYAVTGGTLNDRWEYSRVTDNTQVRMKQYDTWMAGGKLLVTNDIIGKNNETSDTLDDNKVRWHTYEVVASWRLPTGGDEYSCNQFNTMTLIIDSYIFCWKWQMATHLLWWGATCKSVVTVTGSVVTVTPYVTCSCHTPCPIDLLVCQLIMINCK